VSGEINEGQTREKDSDSKKGRSRTKKRVDKVEIIPEGGEKRGLLRQALKGRKAALAHGGGSF